MGTAHYSYEDVIDYAVLIEQRGVKLYTEAAEGLKNEPARNILLHLAEQEKVHSEYFMKLKKDIHANNSRKVELNDESIGYLGALTRSEIFPEDDKPFSERFASLYDVLVFGMQAEKDSILFYTELLGLNWEEPAKKVLQSIVHEEKRHLIQLKELEQLIKERDIYY